MNRSALWKSLTLFWVLFFSADALAQDRSKLLDEMKSLRGQLQAKEQEFLSPSDEDRAAFAEFLKQPETGLIRLLPREKYRNVLLIREGGSFYSFTQLKHEYDSGSDINLEQNRFRVGFAGANFGYMSKLGEIGLDQITLDHPGVKLLADLITASKEPEARAEYRRSSEGLSVGGYIYKNLVPAEVGATYIIRSINYDTSDVLVAFRVIGSDEDGSVLILWKLLKHFPIPKLEQP